MGAGWIGTTGSNRREIVDIRVGTASGTKSVREGWVGTAAGNRKWFTRTEDLGATSSAPTYNTIDISWTDLDQSKFTYNLYRNDVLILAGTTARYHRDSGLAGSTWYNYRVDAIRNGLLWDQAFTTCATIADYVAPPVDTRTWHEEVQPTWQVVCNSSGSYHEDGTLRATNHLWTGYTSDSGAGYRGNQRSTFNFPLPGNLENCYRVNYVHARVRFEHTYGNPRGIGMAVHHNANQASGCSGTFGYFNTSAWGAAEAWMNNEPDNDPWFDITNYRVPGVPWHPNPYTVAEEFQTGAKGLALFSSDGRASNGGRYGHAHGYYPGGPGGVGNPDFWPQIRINYSLWVFS